jgi:hypothetical protein
VRELQLVGEKRLLSIQQEADAAARHARLAHQQEVTALQVCICVGGWAMCWQEAAAQHACKFCVPPVRMLQVLLTRVGRSFLFVGVYLVMLPWQQADNRAGRVGVTDAGPIAARTHLGPESSHPPLIPDSLSIHCTCSTAGPARLLRHQHHQQQHWQHHFIHSSHQCHRPPAYAAPFLPAGQAGRGAAALQRADSRASLTRLLHMPPKFSRTLLVCRPSLLWSSSPAAS